MNPQEAAMNNLRRMLSDVTRLTGIAGKLMDITLRDAVAWSEAGGVGDCPVIMTQGCLVDFHQLKQGLQGLVDHYSEQVDVLSKVLPVSATPAPAPAPAPVPAVDPVEELRRKTAQLADAVPLVRAPASVSEAPARLADDTPTVSGARAAAAARSTLPKVNALPAPAIPSAGQGNNPNRAPLENSIARLLSAQSPLLDIFAPAPWLPDGRGGVTVGSEGFQWYKGTDPFALSNEDRAALPSGFYSGDQRPKFAIVRLETCILVWSFVLDPETMLAYVTEVSDADPSNLRWFKPSELSSSFTRRLVQELAALAEARRQA